MWLSEESDAITFMVEVYREDGGSMFLWDIGSHLPHYNMTFGHNPKTHSMNVHSRETTCKLPPEQGARDGSYSNEALGNVPCWRYRRPTSGVCQWQWFDDIYVLQLPSRQFLLNPPCMWVWSLFPIRGDKGDRIYELCTIWTMNDTNT
jgi:hypothetical protein